MKNRFFLLVSVLVIAIIAFACVLRCLNRDRCVIRVLNSTSRPIEHVQLDGLDEGGDFGGLLPGASKRVDLNGKPPTKAICLSFARIDGKVVNTGTILDSTTEIAGRQFEVQINPDQSVLVSPRELTMLEKLGW